MKKTMRLFPLEVGRLLQSRLTWLTALLTVISPAAGFVLYKPATASTMLTIYLASKLNKSFPPQLDLVIILYHSKINPN